MVLERPCHECGLDSRLRGSDETCRTPSAPTPRCGCLSAGRTRWGGRAHAPRPLAAPRVRLPCPRRAPALPRPGDVDVLKDNPGLRQLGPGRDGARARYEERAAVDRRSRRWSRRRTPSATSTPPCPHRPGSGEGTAATAASSPSSRWAAITSTMSSTTCTTYGRRPPRPRCVRTTACAPDYRDGEGRMLPGGACWPRSCRVAGAAGRRARGCSRSAVGGGRDALASRGGGSERPPYRHHVRPRRPAEGRGDTRPRSFDPLTDDLPRPLVTGTSYDGVWADACLLHVRREGPRPPPPAWRRATGVGGLLLRLVQGG